MDRTDEDRQARLALPCVLWSGPIDGDGYGKDGSKKAYRVAWETEHGPIPKGLELDHICAVRLCRAVYHLDLVTHTENIRRMVERGNHWKQKVTHCPNGHDYADPEHGVIYGGKRFCRTCRRAKQTAARAAGGVGLVDYSCAECGKPGRKVPSSSRRFCSRSCKAANQDRKLNCTVCGTRLPPLSGKRRSCSPECARELRSRANRLRVLTPRP